MDKFIDNILAKDNIVTKSQPKLVYNIPGFPRSIVDTGNVLSDICLIILFSDDTSKVFSNFSLVFKKSFK